jgi:CPA1 family monovalent cation:H+ antiporter
MVWMWTFARPTRFHRPGGPAPLTDTWRERTILGWAGMRGAITLAALLAVPLVTQSGRLLRGRDEIVYLGFAVILATLVGQGMTLPLLVRRINPPESSSLADAERGARLELARSALRLLDDADATRELHAEVVDGLRAQYVGRINLLDAVATDDARDAESARPAGMSERALRLDLVREQRRELLALRAQGRIGSTILRKIERDLDLEEARIEPHGP